MSARIAYVINSVEGGGAALPVPAIARVLRGCDAQVRVFALTRRDGLAIAPMAAGGVEPLVRKGGERDHAAALRWLIRETGAWGATHLWTSLSRATILGLIAGPALGLPVIAWQHAAFLKPWNRRIMRLLQRRAALWVADSQCVAPLTGDRLHISAARLETWPIYAADPAMPQARPWSAGQPIRIGSLGRLHPVKGYDVLVEALAMLRAAGFEPPVPLEITVAGEGDQRAKLEALIQAHRVPLRLSGYTEHPRTYLEGLNLYVQPSRSEGFGIGVHEAMTAGLPVIASRVGEPAFTIEPGKTGFLCVPNQPESLARALREALADPPELARIGSSARAAMLETYSQERFEATGAAIWRRVAQACDQARP